MSLPPILPPPILPSLCPIPRSSPCLPSFFPPPTCPPLSAPLSFRVREYNWCTAASVLQGQLFYDSRTHMFCHNASYATAQSSVGWSCNLSVTCSHSATNQLHFLSFKLELCLTAKPLTNQLFSHPPQRSMYVLLPCLDTMRSYFYELY